MSNNTSASAALAAPVSTQERVINVALWVLQVMLAFQFAGGGLMKISGETVMFDMFATIGIGQWFRYVVGGLEIAGAIGLLIPRTAGLAAIGLSLLLVGATTTNVFVLKTDTTITLVLLVLSGLIAWGRWSRTRALFGK